MRQSRWQGLSGDERERDLPSGGVSSRLSIVLENPIGFQVTSRILKVAMEEWAMLHGTCGHLAQTSKQAKTRISELRQ